MQHFSTSVLFKLKHDDSITDDELEILYLEGWIVLNTFSTKKYDKKCWYDYIWKNQFILKVFLSVIVQAIRRDWIIRMMSLSALIFNAVIKPSIKLDILGLDNNNKDKYIFGWFSVCLSVTRDYCRQTKFASCLSHYIVIKCKLMK